MDTFFHPTDFIYTYTRREALADGVLIDVTPTAREAGFRYPVAVTQAVWHQIISPDEENRAIGQSEEGRLWDVLWMLKYAITLARGSVDTLTYDLLVVRNGASAAPVTLKAVCGPNDDWSPCVTIMLPEED